MKFAGRLPNLRLNELTEADAIKQYCEKIKLKANSFKFDFVYICSCLLLCHVCSVFSLRLKKVKETKLLKMQATVVVRQIRKEGKCFLLQVYFARYKFSLNLIVHSCFRLQLKLVCSDLPVGVSFS